MHRQRQTIPAVVSIVVATTLSWAIPSVVAQPWPTAAQSAVTVQEIVKTDAQGNTVVTERTLRNGLLVREEVHVTNPGGQLISKTDATFNPTNGHVVTRETVTVAGSTVTKVEERFKNGTVVARQEEIFSTHNGQRIQIEREFKMVNEALQLVKEEQDVKKEQAEQQEGVEKESEAKKEDKDKADKENHGAENDSGSSKER